MRTGRRLMAAGSGVGLFFGFAPVAQWPFAILAPAILIILCKTAPRARTAYMDAFVFGLGFFTPLLTWVRAPGTDAWIALSIYQALLFAVLGPLIFFLGRLRVVWPFFAAAAWVAEEAIRDRELFGGFPWGRLAFSQEHSPLLHWVAWGGAPGLTFVVALAASCVAAALLCVKDFALSPPNDSRTKIAKLSAAALLVAGAGGVVVSAKALPEPAEKGQGLRIAVIQGNVPRLGLEAFQQQAAVLANHLNLTEAYAKQIKTGRALAPDIVIWPENASDIDPFQVPIAKRAITYAARTIDRPILVGAVLVGRKNSRGTIVTVRNTGIVWNPDGPTDAMYVKRHPVPFGEYIPFRSILGHVIGRLSLVPADFEKGTKPGILPIGHTTVGDVICFEVAYDGIVRDVVKGGAKLIVVQTNNATFGHSSETKQQLAMSQIRAVEHNRAVVVSATSGISAIIEPDGTVAQRSTIFSAAVLSMVIPQLSSTTAADRVGEGPEWVLVGFTVLGLVGVGATRRLRKVGQANDEPHLRMYSDV